MAFEAPGCSSEPLDLISISELLELTGCETSHMILRGTQENPSHSYPYGLTATCQGHIKSLPSEPQYSIYYHVTLFLNYYLNLLPALLLFYVVSAFSKITSAIWFCSLFWPSILFSPSAEAFLIFHIIAVHITRPHVPQEFLQNVWKPIEQHLKFKCI